MLPGASYDFICYFLHLYLLPFGLPIATFSSSFNVNQFVLFV